MNFDQAGKPRPSQEKKLRQMAGSQPRMVLQLRLEDQKTSLVTHLLKTHQSKETDTLEAPPLVETVILAVKANNQTA